MYVTLSMKGFATKLMTELVELNRELYMRYNTKEKGIDAQSEGEQST